ncbi:reverse transcriptase-like protein [Pontibacillus yanchengensis]|uniref:Reverse transcriptase-like protein n=2 Tax=Pontibacillus yanchengensis TaxID=462910 RepID=A0ACC7VBY4_9BACI|nr:reverse transcriptase-like protein [Pontibacillus yanchengensis]MYL52263.1 reverse transcriptase-like protein [Pontibacillus yanchengensis]
MNVRIELTYKTPKGTEATFRSDEMYVGEAILIAEDLEKTGRKKDISFIDNYDASLTLKEMKQFMKGIQTEPHKITVYFDGGFNVETYQSGLGCAIYYHQNRKSYRLRKNALIDELDSNNEAEYAALHLAIQELGLLNVANIPITFVGDSQVVLNQLNGEWPCMEEELTKWADRVEHDLENLGITPSYKLVSRKGNKEADQLASQALKGIEISSTKET